MTLSQKILNLTQICLWSLFTSVPLFPLHLVFIFVRTLSHCSINEGESNLWRKIDDRNRIFSSLSFSKPKVPAVLPLANSLSENNTSTQAMAVVDIWEPNATMASTFFCCSSVGPGCGFCSCWFWGILASGTLEIEGGGLEKELVLVIIDFAAGGGNEVIEELLLAADAWERAGLEFAAATGSWMSVGLSG